MSPTRNFHGFLAFKTGELLRKNLPKGEVIMECAVDTADGTKETDVAWVSSKRWAIICDEFSSSIAPEICVEVMSASNSREEMVTKKNLYLKAGAEEYWLCHKNGRLEFFDCSGPLKKSKLCPKLPSKISKR